MKKLIFIGAIMMFSNIIIAQNFNDAFRYSQQYYNLSTAKSIAMSGALGAIGADFSTLSSNPAGLGLFRASEVLMTASHVDTDTYCSYNGFTKHSNRNYIPFNSMGIVFAFKNDFDSPRYLQIAFGYNRVADYKSSTYVDAAHINTSMTGDFLERFQGVSPDEIPLALQPAWNTSIIDTLGGLYSSLVSGDVSQNQSVASRGSMNEMVLSSALNIDDKHFFGMTIGLPIVVFHSEKRYEELLDNPTTNIDKWSLTEKIYDEGSGVNLKVGYIVFPAHWLRVGVALHTSTLIDLDEEWELKMTKNSTQVDPISSVVNSNFSYSVHTPARYMFDIAYIMGNHGMLSFDYECINYSRSRMADITYYYDEFDEESISRDYDYYATENQEIKAVLGKASNIKMGFEWNLWSLKLRAGMAYYANPFLTDNFKQTTMSYSCGLGINAGSWIFDLALAEYAIYNEYQLYNNSADVAQTTNLLQTALTIRYRVF